MSNTNDRGTRRSGGAAVARLRDRIDRGETGDKVAFSDPAAAPLGTDAEAGGHSPTVAEVRMADSGRRVPAADEDPTPAPQHRETSCNGLAMLILIAAAVAALGLAVLAL